MPLEQEKDEIELAQTPDETARQGTQLIFLAGETALMLDEHVSQQDIAPLGLGGLLEDSSRRLMSHNRLK